MYQALSGRVFLASSVTIPKPVASSILTAAALRIPSSTNYQLSVRVDPINMDELLSLRFEILGMLMPAHISAFTVRIPQKLDFVIHVLNVPSTCTWTTSHLIGLWQKRPIASSQDWKSLRPFFLP
ncbi:hypothetical protein Y032_0154g2981 [Ancylostoma ceylanicum]|uniref:Uncharacterized protein n=1 Tax=Ancylostoma ceylanicum TaxID=53326 RepID=A0A016SZ37_9BILA|nr:hypothetical protein Y032_0154g2981 [Ancylostoma ceylanicum]